MASQASKHSSTVVPHVLHFAFTVLSIAILSYKVYHLESELSLVRDELFTRASTSTDNGMTNTLPAPSTAAYSIKHDGGSHRNRRLSPQKASETTSDCDLQKMLKDFQVCTDESRSNGAEKL